MAKVYKIFIICLVLGKFNFWVHGGVSDNYGNRPNNLLERGFRKTCEICCEKGYKTFATKTSPFATT